MKKQFNSLKSYFSENPLILFILNIIALSVLWLFFITPMITDVNNTQEALNKENKQLAELQKISMQINSLKDKAKNTPVGTEKSALKEVEEIAQTTGIFARVKRLSPTEKTVSGQKRRGLAITLEGTTLKEVTPFLQKIAQKSILTLHDISLRRDSGETNNEGIINVQLTLLGGI